MEKDTLTFVSELGRKDYDFSSLVCVRKVENPFKI